MADINSFIDLAREVAKSDGDDDVVLTQNCNSAVGVAAGFCRRNLYWDQGTLDAAIAGYPAQLAVVEQTWETAKTNYAPPEWMDAIDRYYSDWQPPTMQDRINNQMLMTAWKSYRKSLSDLGKITDGIVIDDTIVGALLLITVHLYRNRQEVVAEPGAVAIQLPMGAQRILEPYMAV